MTKHYNPEQNRRLVQDVLKGMPTEYVKPPERNPAQLIVDKAKAATNQVNYEWKQFCKAAGILRPQDNPEGAKDFIAQRYLEQFKSWDKEELLFLLTVLHTEIAIERFS